ncbi:MAG TPA: DUF349 domain-containing protein [Kofleriaceae bacterium]|nr:DUF349 domain-containing protein [Kofleriaceae bacterium]
MGIADLFRPKYRHSDVRVRAEAVRALTDDDAAILVQIARTDRDAGVRRLAIERIATADVLAEIAAAEPERSLRDLAGERAAQLWMQHACGGDAERAGAALAGILKLGDQRVLVEVVVRAQVANIRKRAFGEIRDPRALSDLAKSDAPQDLRIAAVARIDDGDVLRALAIDTTQKEVGLAAVDKLDDVERLDHVANKAKSKAVRQRARKIVTEIEEAERAKKPGVPDDVKRRRAEKAQLVREVEAVADSFDFARVAEIVKAAEAAWTKLGGNDEGDDRFTRATERFWRRKEIHDQQARTAEELRAVERDAMADKERAAADRVAKATPEPATPEAGAAAAPEEAADPRRLAREAEARARREERDRQRAEEEARRQAQAAERAARQKEEAERGAAIAASLTALCDDMEGLAAQPRQDTRAIDRLLSQAAKAFEQIGKVPAPERDAIGDRYRIARGKLVTRAGELREAEDWQRWANVPKAEALIETAKQMLEAPATPDLGNRLRGLQALWKEVGPMPQRRSKELWELFKATCDQVYDKVRGIRAIEHEKFAEVAKVKEALIAEAEAVAESTDWASTAEKLKALQQQWKASGHLPRKQGDELWKRFRAACDRFFERRQPEIEARRAEEAANLAAKQQLIARAQAVASAAPAEGGWGKSIAELKELQRQWKDIGFVPRRDADAVYRAFRAACDSLFEKRDEARDAEANAHRAQIDALRGEIDAVIAGGDDAVARAIAARAKAVEIGALAAEVDAMVRHVMVAHPEAVRGTELDPAQLRARRDKLIARAAELLPRQAAAPEAGADLAAQLKAAMRQNAFGDLRFSGRDPVEVIDELRASWAESGPILDEEDRAQEARFDDTVQRVLDAAGAKARPRDERAARDAEGDERGGRRRRRDRPSAEQPAVSEGGEPPRTRASAEIAVIRPPIDPDAPHGAPVGPDLEASAEPARASAPVGHEATVPASVPLTAHDAITIPVRAAPAEPAPGAQRDEPSGSGAAVAAEAEAGWDLGDEDPTAAGEAPDEPEVTTPSATEMAGDGAVEGDGLDSGWD